jgi:predicted SnoaL-like aldol condensation-catalyzing enzyme
MRRIRRAFGRFARPRAIEPRIAAPLVAITAEGDRVVLAFAGTHPDPRDATRTCTTTSFDMFRLRDGRIAEHGDPALKE